MNKNTIISVAAIAVLFFTAVLIKGCFTKAGEVKAVTTLAVHQNDSSIHWFDKYKTEHVKNTVLEAKIDQLSQDQVAQLDDAAQRLQVDRKQIEALQKVVATYKKQITTPVDNTIRHDTVSSFIYADDFTNITGQTVNDSERIQLKIRVPVIVSSYWQRKNKFLGIRYGKIQQFIDGYSSNPNVTLDSISNVRILTKQPGRWGVGPFLGFGANSERLTWCYGLSIHYSLIRW